MSVFLEKNKNKNVQIMKAYLSVPIPSPKQAQNLTIESRDRFPPIDDDDIANSAHHACLPAWPK